MSFTFAAMYGIAVAALGMLSTIATGLAIDAYGPISDNAGGIAEMAGMSHRIRERTDALDAAGNTTAAIGKVLRSSYCYCLKQAIKYSRSKWYATKGAIPKCKRSKKPITLNNLSVIVGD